jgi:hypothetical protein
LSKVGRIQLRHSFSLAPGDDPAAKHLSALLLLLGFRGKNGRPDASFQVGATD